MKIDPLARASQTRMTHCRVDLEEALLRGGLTAGEEMQVLAGLLYNLTIANNKDQRDADRDAPRS